MHIKKLKLHTCGCISRCCGCNHRTGGNQWCTQYNCQYVPQSNCTFHLTSWKRKPKEKNLPLIEEQREAQAIVLEGLKKRWATEEREQLQKAKQHEEDAGRGFVYPQYDNFGTNLNSTPSSYKVEPKINCFSSKYGNNTALSKLQQNLKSEYLKLFTNQNQNTRHQSQPFQYQQQHQAGNIQFAVCNNNNIYNNTNRNRAPLEQYNNPMLAFCQESQPQKTFLVERPAQNHFINNPQQPGIGSIKREANAPANMYHPRDPQILDCFTQQKNNTECFPNQTACPNEISTTYNNDFDQNLRRPPTVADCYGVNQAFGCGAQRSGYGVQPPSSEQFQSTYGHAIGGQGTNIMEHGDCYSNFVGYHNEECPYAKPLSDIMEPRHYLNGSKDWKGVPLPFQDCRYELLLPSSHDTFQLMPSPNPFVYTGRKRRGPEDRFHGPEQPLPVSAKRPAVFGNEYGIEQTTNHLGYRPQRRHYKDRPSFILFN